MMSSDGSSNSKHTSNKIKLNEKNKTKKNLRSHKDIWKVTRCYLRVYEMLNTTREEKEIALTLHERSLDQ